MRDIHTRMLAAVLDGEGLRGLAELAAEEAGGPVAILLPARGLSVASSVELDPERLSEDTVVACVPVEAGGETLACLTEVAVLDARDELASEVRGTLLEDVREGRAPGEDVVRRAARLGCELGRGAVALVAEVHSSRPRHAAALITSAHSGAIAELLGGTDPQRVYALLPAPAGEDPADATLASARVLVGRLRSHGLAAFSSFCSDPSDLGRAISEAELASDYNMNATARAIYAHRHTVAHRLGRVKELTGLDPAHGEDRERLGLGAKAYRLLEPTLPS